jgi:hypothetical protein
MIIMIIYTRLTLVLMITHDTTLLIRIFSMSRFSNGCETLAITDKVVAKYSDIPTLGILFICVFCSGFQTLLFSEPQKPRINI